MTVDTPPGAVAILRPMTAQLPPRLAGLPRLATNLRWDWCPEIAAVFAALAPDIWARSDRNAMVTLDSVTAERAGALAEDTEFLAILERAESAAVAPRTSWFREAHPDAPAGTIGYFCAEYGLTECLPIYSGGLGILAGDHLKSASDLGLPLVAVGLLYRHGYFRQALDARGRQRALHPRTDFGALPMSLELDEAGAPRTISVEIGDHPVHARIWRVDVDRVPLFLLDTDIDANSREDRRITDALYQGGDERRVQQLMLLGIGGHRALCALGHEPAVCHLNEGHAGFVGVEMIARTMRADGVDLETARRRVAARCVFTTHTPVPAGFDRFDPSLLEAHMARYLASIGLGLEAFLELGRPAEPERLEPEPAPTPQEEGRGSPGWGGEALAALVLEAVPTPATVERGALVGTEASVDTRAFNMAVLALRCADRVNGVSELHAEVSRALLQAAGGWSTVPVDQVPIGAVTNGIHVPTWMGAELQALLDARLGPAWRTAPLETGRLSGVIDIEDEALWAAHGAAKRRTVELIRRRLRWQRARQGAPESEVLAAESLLDPEALTIGFARRFATYKRARLLFEDPVRLRALVQDARQPVQFVFSGKAHPADRGGQALITQIVQTIREFELGARIVFLEDYDISVGKALVQGVDVWLNNPQRPHEASGTSGMKVSANAGLNLSVLDGWWAEAWRPEVGWAIGEGEDWAPGRDEGDAEILYRRLEQDVIPKFYDRDEAGLPRGWIRMMKAALATLTARFSTDRMVADYVERAYLPALRARG